MKNLKKVLFSLVVVIGMMFFCITPAYAKKGVVIVPDPNPDGVENCSVDPEYPAYSDEEEDNEEQNDENKKPGKENNKKNNKK